LQLIDSAGKLAVHNATMSDTTYRNTTIYRLTVRHHFLDRSVQLLKNSRGTLIIGKCISWVCPVVWNHASRNLRPRLHFFLESESCACQEQESSTEESFLTDVQLPLAQTNQAQRIGGTRLREEVNILFSSLLACCFTTVCPQEVFLRIFLCALCPTPLLLPITGISSFSYTSDLLQYRVYSLSVLSRIALLLPGSSVSIPYFCPICYSLLV